jgi:RecA/RadA recombinase
LVSSHNIFLGRPWTHSTKDAASSLHRRLKYIANGRLVTVKLEETITMMRNVVKPYIKTEVVKDKDLHAFEIVNLDLISEHTIKR